MKKIFLLGLVIFLLLGIVTPRLFIRDDNSLSQAEISCAKTKAYAMFKQPFERLLIQNIATVRKDGETIVLNAHSFWGIKYSQITVICNSQPETKILNTSKCAQLSEFCGGIAGIICCEGLSCNYEGNYPDSGGKCLVTNQ